MAAAPAARLYLDRESPPLLLALNAAGYFFLVPDAARAQALLAPGSARAAEAAAAFYIVLGGATLYALKLPERLAPRRFDYILHSHMLWHVCYFAAYSLLADVFVRCAREAQAAPPQ